MFQFYNYAEMFQPEEIIYSDTHKSMVEDLKNRYDLYLYAMIIMFSPLSPIQPPFSPVTQSLKIPIRLSNRSVKWRFNSSIESSASWPLCKKKSAPLLSTILLEKTCQVKYSCIWTTLWAAIGKFSTQTPVEPYS